jgi:uncharacterized protein (TIGR03437 family)
VKRIILLSLLALPCAFGYITQTIAIGGQNYTIKQPDPANMSFYLNDKVTAGLTVAGKSVLSSGSNPAAAAQAALDAWNGVSTANIHFNTLQSTSIGHFPDDCKNVIEVATSANDITAVGGALAFTSSFYSGSTGTVCNTPNAPPGSYVDTDIIFSPAFSFSTDATSNTIDFQSVLTHELGHSLGANHSALIGATMFWATGANQYNQRTLSSDDIDFVTALYPGASANLGTLTGTISQSNGSPVKFGLVTAIDRTAGTTYGSITGADGTFSVAVPPGSYIVYAEPFNSSISSSSIYSTSTSTGFLDPAQVTTGYLPTFLGGTASPTATPVTAGGNATINITVTSGTSALTTPFYGIGAAGANGDISGSLVSLGSAITVASGQSIDIGIGAGGIDADTTFLVFGRGISVKTGSIRSDSKINLGNGQPLMRFTLDIPAQSDTTIASLWIVKGNSVMALSGGLVITPAKPVINAVLDAESARPSFTSGQWVAVYGSNLAGTTRFWNDADFTGGVTPGSPLPSSLDGVSVTVNGVAASVYLVSPGQLNILTPSDLTPGPVNVVVTNHGSVSAPFQATVVQASPSFFYYFVNGKYYPLAAHLNGKFVGDPAVMGSSYEKAHPGELLLMFVNGVAPSTGGVIATVREFPLQVSISAGANALSTTNPYLVAAGEFQINATLPAGLAAGEYTLTMSAPGGSTADSGLTLVLPVAP